MADLRPPPNAAARSRSFLLWAFIISVGTHFVLGNLLPHLPNLPSPEPTPVAFHVDRLFPAPPPPTPPPPTPTPKPTKPRPVASIAARHPRPHVAPPRTLNHGSGPSEPHTYVASGDNTLDIEAVKAARASTYAPEIEDCTAVGGQYIFRAEFTAQ
jgi:hypothetical protein